VARIASLLTLLQLKALHWSSGAGAKAAATSLSNAAIINIPGVGHFVSPASPCTQAVIVSFLADLADRVEEVEENVLELRTKLA
jgi:hypothetical protein